jgi:hypothetical protein
MSSFTSTHDWDISSSESIASFRAAASPTYLGERLAIYSFRFINKNPVSGSGKGLQGEDEARCGSVRVKFAN